MLSHEQLLPGPVAAFLSNACLAHIKLFGGYIQETGNTGVSIPVSTGKSRICCIHEGSFKKIAARISDPWDRQENPPESGRLTAGTSRSHLV